MWAANVDKSKSCCQSLVETLADCFSATQRQVSFSRSHSVQQSSSQNAAQLQLLCSWRRNNTTDAKR